MIYKGKGTDRKKTTMDIPDVLARSILGTSADTIIATDREGMIRFWNPGPSGFFNTPPRKPSGRSSTSSFPSDCARGIGGGYRHVMETGESRYGRGDLLAVSGVRKDGTVSRLNSPSSRSSIRAVGSAASPPSCAT